MQGYPNSGPIPAGYGQPQTTLPILTLDNGDDGSFEYSAFFYDQQNINYLTADGSGSGSDSGSGLPINTPSPSSSSGYSGPPFQDLTPPKQQQRQQLPPLMARPPAYTATAGQNNSGSSGSSQEQAVVPKPRFERRGHTKSRRGCFNCKRRRIKCQETKPACGHCVKQGLKCEYPALPTIAHQPQHKIPLFSLQDMRCFQHFLLNCYPHHPIGSEELWLHEIPCLSEKHEFLMHGILGYAASELMATQDPSLAEAALLHRYKAIKAIKKSLAQTVPVELSPCTDSGGETPPPAAPSSSEVSRSGPPQLPPGPPPSRSHPMFEEGNALIATCFALTYQSVLLEDGLAEYMTFIRGIVIVAIQMYIRGADILFAPFLGDRSEVLEPHMRDLPLIKAEWAARAVRSLEGLRPLVDGVEGREVEQQYLEMLNKIAKMLSVNSWEAYRALTEHYAWWMLLPHDKFRLLIDPGNQLAILLGAHWISLEQIMTTICKAEEKAAAKMPRRSNAGVSVGTGWLGYLNKQVDYEYRQYNEWPMWVEEKLRRDRKFFRYL
ncbi:hypothetical protein VTH82DRAFT_8258 [Thermothelomyces myriococcoides]